MHFFNKTQSVKSNTYDAKPMIALANESNNNIVKRAIIAGKLSFMFLMFLIKIFRLNYRNYVLFKQGYLELNFDNFLMMISLSSLKNTELLFGLFFWIFLGLRFCANALR